MVLVWHWEKETNSTFCSEGELKPQSSYFKLEEANKRINFILEATGFKTVRGTRLFH